MNKRTTCRVCGSPLPPRRLTLCSHDCRRRAEGVYSRAYHARHPLVNVAVRKVDAAVKRGVLASPLTLSCADCGKQAQTYDHRDYTKPLDVVPVCRSCNKKRGPGAPYIEAA